LVLPDGVPTYVFDRQGRMVDWSPYSSDDPKFQARWTPESRNQRPVSGLSVKDAQRWFEP
jgi:hypothetical protein